VVIELIQDDFNAANLEKELKNLLDEGKRVKIISEYSLLREKLGGEGASKRAASSICKALGIEPGT